MRLYNASTHQGGTVMNGVTKPERIITLRVRLGTVMNVSLLVNLSRNCYYNESCFYQKKETYFY